MSLSRMSIGLAGAVLLLASTGVAVAETVSTRPDLMALFKAEGVTGTFVLLDVAEERMTIVNDKRAERRYTPASTFKIANSLIALDTGAVTDVDEVIPYGGKPQMVKAWERDMSLREAIAVSNVAVYQEVARRVGLARMTAMLEQLGYGDCNPGTVVDRFWLDGPLAISAIEQTRFVAALATNTLQLSARSQALVREIMPFEEIGGARLYGKTGWLFGKNPQLGWYTGWVERDGAIRAFALNIDMTGSEQAKLRIPLAKAFLGKLGAL